VVSSPEWLGNLWTRIVQRALLGRAWPWGAGLALCAAALFWLLRNRTRLLGDGELLAEHVSRGTLFHGFDHVTFHAHARLFQILGLAGEPQSVTLFAVVSVMAGVVYVMLARWGLRALYGASEPAAVGLGLLLLGCHTLLFYGYVECYAPLAVGMLWFAIEFARYYRGQGTVIRPAVAFAASLFMHPNGLFLAPALVGLCLFPRSGPREHRPASACPALVLIPAASLLLSSLLLSAAGGGPPHDLAARLRDSVLPWTGETGILSFRHGKDLFNLFLLLAAVPVAVIVAARARPAPGSPWSAETKALACGLGGLALITIVLNMRLGMVRDWDLVAPHSVFLSLGAVSAWARPRRRSFSTPDLGLVLVAAGFLFAPWIAINAQGDYALNRFRSVVRDLDPYARAYAHEEVARLLRDRGDWNSALTEYETALQASPHNPRLRVAHAELLYRAGRETEAIQSLEAVVGRDSTYVPAVRLLAEVYLSRGDPRASLEMSRRLHSITPGTLESLINWGRAAEELRLADEAFGAYARAMGLAPQRLDIIERMVQQAIILKGAEGAQARFRAMATGGSSPLLGRVCLALALCLPLRESPQLWSLPASQAQRALHSPGR